FVRRLPVDSTTEPRTLFGAAGSRGLRRVVRGSQPSRKRGTFTVTLPKKGPDRRVRMNVSKFAGAIREWRVTRARAAARLIAAGSGEISRFWRDRPGACRRRPVLARAMIRWSQGDQRGIAASHRAYQG